MESKAVSNTGPILHLSEIDSTNCLNIFSRILIPKEVENELVKNKIPIPRKVKVAALNSKAKDNVKILTYQYNLDLGESEAISLALQEKSDYFLTDDLEARQIAKKYNIEVHGTIGIILRSFREKILDKKTAIEKVRQLKADSSLFITQDLIGEIILSINDFRK